MISQLIPAKTRLGLGANLDYIIVYEFGGGTLDVSVLQVSRDGYVEVMGSDGDENLGGADFDAAVAHFLLDGDQVKRQDLEKSHFCSCCD